MLVRLVAGTGWAFTAPVVQHLTLVLAFLGAYLAAREGKLLRLATDELWKTERARPFARYVQGGTTLVTTFVCGLLARASFDLTVLEHESETMILEGLVPLAPVLLCMPLGFALVGLHEAWGSKLGLAGRIASFAVLVVGWLAAAEEGVLFGAPVGVAAVALVLVGLLGAPLFVPLAGIPLLLFLADETPAMAVPVEMYSLASSPFLPAIPLFTLVGFVLTEGGAPERLLRLFRAAFGWLPGGTAVIAALVCAFFSIFTGGSGVTILALGGLLFQALSSDGYRERFSLGLLAGSGSLGILLPPALPLILYGIAAQVPIEELFLAGLLPGALMIALVCIWGARAGYASRVVRTPFRPAEVGRALWGARFELLAPLLALAALFSGYATLLEASALTAVYALVAQVVFTRDIPLGRLWTVLRNCGAVLGGVLIILCCAQGLSNYLVDAQVPMRLLAWIRESIDSPWTFLLCLNLFLIVVGCFLDIYSATFVVVPLILPLARAFDVDPVHLGIIFVANLELGYLTPPVGLNLFLASYRFERPLVHVIRAALPMLLILGIGVLLITYVPWFSSALR